MLGLRIKEVFGWSLGNGANPKSHTSKPFRSATSGGAQFAQFSIFGTAVKRRGFSCRRGQSVVGEDVSSCAWRVFKVWPESDVCKGPRPEQPHRELVQSSWNACEENPLAMRCAPRLLHKLEAVDHVHQRDCADRVRSKEAVCLLALEAHRKKHPDYRELQAGLLSTLQI